MPRRNERKGCELWESAKILAENRGLEMHGTCPIDPYCDGPICVFISETGDTGPQQVEKFYTRLEKHSAELDKRKLQQCRQDLEAEKLKQQIIKEG